MWARLWQNTMPGLTRPSFCCKKRSKKSSIPGLRFLTHRHSVLGCRRLRTDGVHLNNSGMRGFRRSTVFLTFQSLPTGPFQGHKMKISCVIGICMDVCVSMSVCVCKVMCLHVYTSLPEALRSNCGRCVCMSVNIVCLFVFCLYDSWHISKIKRPHFNTVSVRIACRHGRTNNRVCQYYNVARGSGYEVL